MPPDPWVPAAVVFDCDGVLIDSEIVVCRLTAEELTGCGFAIGTEGVIERFAGRPEEEMVAELEAEWGRTLPPAYFERVRARIAEAYAGELRAVPGVTQMLGRLKAARCVASSSYPSKLEMGLRAAGLFEAFAPDIVSAAFVARGKPAPDVFVYAAGWLRVPVAHCLAIEDSVPGVRAAVAAGMRVFGFTGGTHCRPGHGARLLAAGAAQVFGTFDALEALQPGIW